MSYKRVNHPMFTACMAPEKISAEKPKRTKTITFQPDAGVKAKIEKVLNALGNPRGLRSAMINDALRDAWDAVARRHQVNLGAALKDKKQGTKE